MKQYFYIVDLIRNIYCSSCSNEDSDNIDCSVLVENILHNNQKDELFLLHLGFTNNICLNSTNSISTICDSVYETNNRFLEYKKQFYDFLKQSYTIHTDAFIRTNDNVESSICFSQRVDKYVYDLLDYIEQHNKQMATIYKILYLMLLNKSECLTGGSCRILLDIIGFYDHVYTNLIRSPYCDNVISAVKDLLVGIAILPETIQPTITRDQYLQSLEALLTNTPSGVTITFGNVSNQLIEFLATLFATNPRAYIYYTTSFDIEDNRLTTFANELSNNLSTYLDENHPLYRDLLVVLLSTNLA
jgi:hypothetical protein